MLGLESGNHAARRARYLENSRSMTAWMPATSAGKTLLDEWSASLDNAKRLEESSETSIVIPGLEPGIHAAPDARYLENSRSATAWMPATSAGKTLLDD